MRPARLQEEARWSRIRVLAVLVLLAVSVGTWLLFGKGISDEEPASMEMRIMSVKETFPTALAAAREWRPDAILEDADIWFRRQTDPRELRIGYGFRSPGEPRAWLNVWVIERGDGLDVVLQEGEFELPEPKPIGQPVDPMSLPLDSPEVLRIMLDNGGREFIAQHLYIHWPMSIILRYRDLYYSRGDLLWVGLFFEMLTGDDLDIAINAVTGELEK